MRWFLGLWYERQRQTDLKILWPICKANAPDLDHAKAAFAVHACNDRAWLHLGQQHINAIIDALE